MPKRDLAAIAAAAGADLVPMQKGRGVAGMLSFHGEAGIENARKLPLSMIDVNPAQARQNFDETALAELAASIKQHGLLQPIGVLRQGERYVILFGERRYRAARLAGLIEIPTLVYEGLDEADRAVLTALENLQREDLDLEDEARQFARLVQVTGLSQRALAEYLGKDYNYISRRIRLLKRPELFAAIRSGALTLDAALAQLAGDRDEPAAPPAPERAERDDVAAVSSRHSSGSTPARYRYVGKAYAELQRIKPDTVPRDEAAAWMQQLQELATYATQLSQAIAAAHADDAPA